MAIDARRMVGNVVIVTCIDRLARSTFDLFGGSCVVREIGRVGRMRVIPYPTASEPRQRFR